MEKINIYYKDVDNKYKILAKDFEDKNKAEEWADCYSKVFDCKCKVVKGELDGLNNQNK